jgi:hypothetical protein
VPLLSLRYGMKSDIHSWLHGTSFLFKSFHISTQGRMIHILRSPGPAYLYLSPNHLIFNAFLMVEEGKQ